MANQNVFGTQSSMLNEQEGLVFNNRLSTVRQSISARSPFPRYVNSEAAVLIPAWNPESHLLRIVTELIACNFGALIIVDDGSGAQSAALLAKVKAMPSVHLIRHAVNRGKGRALKSGIDFFLSKLSLDILVTADADGQHAVDDIVRVAQAAHIGTPRVVLGARVFSKDIPLRSRFGNLLTRRIFSLVTGITLADTQTGLRAFPRSLLSGLLALEGERYEYEMTVLAHLCRNGAKPVEVPIRTIYLEDNRSSHFDPVRDSIRIYFVLLRFYFSSLFTRHLHLHLHLHKEAV